MGDVISMASVEETLIFGDQTAGKQLLLIQHLAAIAQRLLAAQTCAERYRVHEHLIRLQTEYAEAISRVRFVADALDEEHRNRSKLLQSIPENEITILIVRNDDEAKSLIGVTARSGAVISCLDFELLETTDQGVRTFFGRRSLNYPGSCGVCASGWGA